MTKYRSDLPQQTMSTFMTNGGLQTYLIFNKANASCKSHAALNESETLDAGDKYELARGYLHLKKLLPNFSIIGGCCGTDHTHMEEISKVWFEK